MRTRWAGCGTALVTPFTAAGEVDERAVRRLARRQVDGGVHFLVPCGTTGESPTLSRAEKLRVVELVVDEAAGAVPVLAGAGGYDTRAVVDLVRDLARAGAAGVLSVTPYYNKPTPEGLFRHYGAVADAADLPLVVYNVPGRTACNVAPATLLRIAEIANVVGVKEASGDLGQIGEICRAAPDGFRVLSGDDAFTLAVMALGGAGVVSVVSNEAPDRMAALVNQAAAGDFAAARAAHESLLPLMQANFLESNPIPVKAALAELGLLDLHYRLPLTPPSPETRARIREALAAVGLSQPGGPAARRPSLAGA